MSSLMRRGFVSVKPPRNIAKRYKVVMDASRLDEGTLAGRYNFIHLAAQTDGYSLSNNLGDHED